LESNVLDFAVLMSYYKDPVQIWQSVLNAREIADSRRIVAGFDVSALPAEMTARQILLTREQDLKGYSLFALDRVVLRDPQPYLARLKALTAADAADTRYGGREPLWNRVAFVDDAHRTFSLRFYSRTGRTKLVVYPRGITALRFSVNDQVFQPLHPTGADPVSIDLSAWLNPAAREVVANHDFTLTATAEGPPEAFAEIFTVDYYAAPAPAPGR
jgi:hypothetical protein